MNKQAVLNMKKRLKQTHLYTRHANGQQEDEKIGWKCKSNPQCNNYFTYTKIVIIKKINNN